MEIDINSREKLIAALEQAGRSQLRKKKARLREIYDSVLLAKSQDLGEKTIIQLLSAQGLHFSRSGFAVTMHRIKKDLEKEASRATPKASPSSITKTPTTTASQPSTSVKTKGEEPQTTNPQRAHFSPTAQQRSKEKANKYTSSMDEALALKLIEGAKQ